MTIVHSKRKVLDYDPVHTYLCINIVETKISWEKKTLNMYAVF